MTDIIITTEGKYHSIQAVGHADDSLVCCAVSTLLQTLQAVVYNAEDVKPLFVNVASGNVDITFECEPDSKPAAAFDTVVLGIKMLEHTYPKNIKIKD